MITMNIAKEDRLTNGVRGFIADIDEEQKIIWVKFQDTAIGQRRIRSAKKKLASDPEAIPIYREKASFTFGKGGSVVRINRTQYPLVLCYAITAHKSQGLTLDSVLVDFTNTEGKIVPVQKGCFYVAITRVRKSDNLFLTKFSPRFIQRNEQVETEISRMTQRAQYEFFKV